MVWTRILGTFWSDFKSTSFAFESPLMLISLVIDDPLGIPIIHVSDDTEEVTS